MTEPGDGVDVAAQPQLVGPQRTTELLLRVRDGDLTAWDEILRRYGTVVSATVRSFQLQEADALDAIQMTWLRMVENAGQVRFPERLGGWLAITARRECLRIVRQVKLSANFTDVASEAVADPSSDPEQRTVDADNKRTLWKLVDELPPRRQTLIRMLYTDNPCSYAELARTVGMSPNGIGSTRARALRQLRLGLDKSGAWHSCP